MYFVSIHKDENVHLKWSNKKFPIGLKSDTKLQWDTISIQTILSKHNLRTPEFSEQHLAYNPVTLKVKLGKKKNKVGHYKNRKRNQ